MYAVTEQEMSGQRTYSKELKAEAIKMVMEKGHSHAEVSKRLSIPSGTIGSWISKAKKNPEIIDPEGRSVADMAAEIRRLKKDLARAEMEREILKKATAYFAKES